MAISDQQQDQGLGGSDGALPGEHIAAMARAVVLMGRLATSITTQARMSPDQLALVRELLPTLAARHHVRARLEADGDLVAITFARLPT